MNDLPKTDETPRFRAGLIGCGVIARAHAKALAKHGFDLKAVCALGRSSAEEFARTHARTATPPEVDDTAQELVNRDDLDLVVIATPPAVHAEQCITALKAGKAVLCEKPSSLSPQQDDAIAAAAKASDRHIAFCSSRMRYGGYTDAARHAVETGRLGTIYRAEIRLNRPQHRPGVDWMTDLTWFTRQDRAGGGVLFDMGIYPLDQMFHILGWPAVRTVDCTTFHGHPHDLPASQVYDVEEHANLFARLDPLPGQDAEIALTLDISACAHEPAYHKITLLGTDAGIEISHGSGENSNSYRGTRFLPIAVKGGRALVETAGWDAPAWNGAPHYQLFHQYLRGQGPGPGTTIEEARQLSALIQKAYRSAEQGMECV